MYGNQFITVRLLGLVIVGGVLTTGLSFYLSRKKGKNGSSGGHRLSRAYSDYDEINSREEASSALREASSDSPLDFRVIIHGGAGVVSKGIDSKPFFDALTRIMADAYAFAKAGGESVSGEHSSVLHHA